MAQMLDRGVSVVVAQEVTLSDTTVRVDGSGAGLVEVGIDPTWRVRTT